MAKINTSKRNKTKHKIQNGGRKMLNVGVIGRGGMGKDHIKRLMKKPDAQASSIRMYRRGIVKGCENRQRSKGLYRWKRSDQ